MVLMLWLIGTYWHIDGQHTFIVRNWSLDRRFYHPVLVTSVGARVCAVVTRWWCRGLRSRPFITLTHSAGISCQSWWSKWWELLKMTKFFLEMSWTRMLNLCSIWDQGALMSSSLQPAVNSSTCFLRVWIHRSMGSLTFVACVRLCLS